MAMLWRLRAHERRRSLQAAAVALALVAGLVAAVVLVARAPRQPEVIAPPSRPLVGWRPPSPCPRRPSLGRRHRRRGGVGGRRQRHRRPRRPQDQPSARRPGAAASRVAAGGRRAGPPVAGGRGGRHGQPGRPWRPPAADGQRRLAVDGANPAEEGFRLAVDGGSVWVAVQHTGVAHIDWTRGKVTSRFTRPPGAGYDLIAAGGGAALTHGARRTPTSSTPGPARPPRSGWAACRPGRPSPPGRSGPAPTTPPWPASTRPAAGWSPPSTWTPSSCRAGGGGRRRGLGLQRRRAAPAHRPRQQPGRAHPARHRVGPAGRRLWPAGGRCGRGGSATPRTTRCSASTPTAEHETRGAPPRGPQTSSCA